MTEQLRYVVKRDGRLETFARRKIAQAIAKAFEAVYPGEQAPDIKIDMLTTRVEERLAELMAGRHANSAPAIEEIQDLVEDVLIESRESRVAKAYIIYRARHEAIRDTRSLMLDIDQTMDGYLSMSDWRVNENANVNFSLGGLILHNSGTITANYWLKNIYPPLHVLRLLCGMEPSSVDRGGARGRPGQDHIQAGAAPLNPGAADGELSRDHAERMGRRAGVLEL